MQAGRQAGRQADRQTDRQADRQKDKIEIEMRHRDIETQRHKGIEI